MRVFTVGYGGRGMDDFIRLLKDNRVEVVVDVRSYPKSQFEDYNRENLQKRFPREGMEYVFLGNKLGGLREGPYQDHMQTDDFKEGIGEVMTLADTKRVTLMCAEKQPTSCHRRHICDHLATLGIEVQHILEGTAVQGRLM